MLHTGGVRQLQVSCHCNTTKMVAEGRSRIHDALLTRLSNDDDMEKSLSTFANEMASSAMNLGGCQYFRVKFLMVVSGIATSNSLILIDEVGRGTSPLEGVGISHAIAEKLIDMKVLQFNHRP